MPNEVTTFDFHGNHVRVFDREGEPWFVLADVCEALGVAHAPTVAARLPADEKSTVALRNSAGGPERTIISEAGLYRVVMRSDKPKAEEFQTWVVRDVLPTIRKTGKYDGGYTARKRASVPKVSGALITASMKALDSVLARLPSLSEPAQQGVIGQFTGLFGVNLPLAVIESKLYDCTSIADALGMTVAKLSKDQRYKDLRTEPYGEWVASHVGGSTRSNWNWNERGRAALLAAFASRTRDDGDGDGDSVVNFPA